VLDEDNEHTYPRLPGFIYEVVKTNGKRGITFPLNQAAIKYCNEYEFIGFWGDDHRPNTQSWNVSMYELLNNKKPYSMAYANDLLQGEKLATQIIIDSLYIRKLGYFVHPSIQHLYGDDFLMYIGRKMNNIHYLANVIIEHEHYTAGKAPQDSLYLELNSSVQFSEGEKNYKNIINSPVFNEQLNQLNQLKNVIKTPCFQENDKLLFYKYLDKSNFYFEFGSGGSTYQASIKNNIKKIYSVESDLEWHNNLKSILENTDKINFIFNDMDVRQNNWGHPGPNSTREQKMNYSSQILNLSEEEKKDVDLVLIDGRFRVACCLKCFNSINDDCFIIFDDFLNREEYNIVLDYYYIVEQTADCCMVVLKKKSNITSIPDELVKKYELIEN